MADQKVSDLPSLNGADVDPADLLYIVDSSAGTAGSKKITVGQFQIAPFSGSTADTVLYLNGSKVLSSSSALTFDGTNFSTTGTATATKFIPTGNVTAGNGMYLPAANNLAWSINGSEQMRLTSTGLGIGTSSPAYKLTVSGGDIALDNARAINFKNSSGGYGNVLSVDSSNRVNFGDLVTSASAMVLSSGNLGLGVTPSAWGSGYKSIELSTRGANITGDVNFNYTYVGANNFHNGSAWTYKVNGFATRYAQGDGTHLWYTAPSGTAGNAISFTQAMTLDASGNLGVGSTSPSARLEVKTTSSSTDVDIRNSTTLNRITADGGDLLIRADYVNSTANSTIQFSVDGTERARITSGGEFLFNTTSTDQLSVGSRVLPDVNGSTFASTSSKSAAGNQGFLMYSTGAAAYRFYVDWDGKIYATNTTISAISDQRYKENIRDLDIGLNAIMALKPRKFDWKAGKGKDIKDDRGFIAQEFEQVFPDLIDEWKDPAPEGEEPYKSVRQDLIPVLVKAIQEQQALITALTARVAALEAKP